MNKPTSIARVALLLALGLCAFALLFGTPALETTTAGWAIRFIASKVAAAILAAILARLYLRWSHTDPWISAYSSFCDRLAHEKTPASETDKNR